MSLTEYERFVVGFLIIYADVFKFRGHFVMSVVRKIYLKNRKNKAIRKYYKKVLFFYVIWLTLIVDIKRSCGVDRKYWFIIDKRDFLFDFHRIGMEFLFMIFNSLVSTDLTTNEFRLDLFKELVFLIAVFRDDLFNATRTKAIYKGAYCNIYDYSDGENNKYGDFTKTKAYNAKFLKRIMKKVSKLYIKSLKAQGNNEFIISNRYIYNYFKEQKRKKILAL